ncbi:ATP-binding protein [Amycolatopsis sp.]|jgi:signal transduction histidine kinase|uniref:ATP-binding protein n=1 Tax=Amycolatopsis sp. TaxID=37632 RepID=UPI002E06D3D7|nr:ATP-binding protein [Amycolatopsis sp.]
MANVWARMSTRVRVALFAGLSAAVALSAGAIWFVSLLQQRLEVSAQDLSSAHVTALIGLLRTGADPAAIPDSYQFGPFDIVNADGVRVGFNCESPIFRVAQAVDENGRLLPSATDDSCLSSLGLSSGTWEVTDDRKYTVHAAVQVDPAGLEVVDAAKSQALWGVPVLVLLISTVAWFAARGSLRPVKALSDGVGEITANDLSRRVAVPPSGDEITQLARRMNLMLDRVEDSSVRQRRFTEDASHELRTPLASMRTQLEIQLAHPDRIDWRKTVADVGEDVERMQALVTDLMLLVRVEGAQPSPLEPVDLAGVVADSLGDRQFRKGLEVDFDAADVTVLADQRLERVIRNLLDNAERYASETIEIWVKASDSDVVLAVENDGPPIPEAERERVFERFVRLDEARDRDSGGSGLGLAIAREIMVSYGGTLKVERGARFVARFPLPPT